jgi:hypothetical protein
MGVRGDPCHFHSLNTGTWVYSVKISGLALTDFLIMKSFFLACTFIYWNNCPAQSPSLSLLLKMDSLEGKFSKYKIEMKFCEPTKMTKRRDRFSHDTSKIDFSSLKSKDISCGEYFSSNEGLIQLSGGKDEVKGNSYEFSGQLFAWEKILVFKISPWSSRGWWPEMYVVVPIKHKSFITHVEFTNLVFQSGKVIFLSELNAFYDESKLSIDQSLKNEKAISVEQFNLKGILK